MYKGVLDIFLGYNRVLSFCIEKELMDWHRPRLKILLDSGVDLVAVETIPALVCLYQLP